MKAAARKLPIFHKGSITAATLSYRREETLKGKNSIAIEMVERALKAGVVADYLLVDSWYAKPEFSIEQKSLASM